MKKISVVISLFVLLGLSGCLWPFSGGHKNPEAGVVPVSVSVEVLNPARLKTGGKLYFAPFSAGVDAPAGEAIDRMALMMVKGASDILATGSRFVLVSGDDAASADIVVRGRIETFRPKGGFKRGVVMEVRGDVRGAHGEEVLALIYDHRDAADALKSADQAAYAVGYAIGEKLQQ